MRNGVRLGFGVLVLFATFGRAENDLTDVTTAEHRVQARAREEAQVHASYLTPISIFGRVIDENGTPIPDAGVEIGIADDPIKTGSRYIRKTDSQGLFSLEGVHGIAFTLKASKDGYYTTNTSKLHRNVVVPSTNDGPSPTKNKPVTLVLKVQGETTALMRTRTRQVQVPRDGKPVLTNLLNGLAGDGPLRIASWIGPEAERQFDWRYELSVPDGGIVERTGEFDFQSPTDGYKSSAIISMPTNAPQWTARVAKSFFVRFADGRYGRLAVNFYPGQRRNFVVIESHLNPTPGSRNLEYDPAKEIKHP